MKNSSKVNQKIQKRMGELWLRNRTGCCWVCGSQSGVKAGREGYTTRCKKCVAEGKETQDTILYAKLKVDLNT